MGFRMTGLTTPLHSSLPVTVTRSLRSGDKLGLRHELDSHRSRGLMEALHDVLRMVLPSKKDRKHLYLAKFGLDRKIEYRAVFGDAAEIMQKFGQQCSLVRSRAEAHHLGFNATHATLGIFNSIRNGLAQRGIRRHQKPQYRHEVSVDLFGSGDFKDHKSPVVRQSARLNASCSLQRSRKALFASRPAAPSGPQDQPHATRAVHAGAQGPFAQRRSRWNIDLLRPAASQSCLAARKSRPTLSLTFRRPPVGGSNYYSIANASIRTWFCAACPRLTPVED